MPPCLPVTFAPALGDNELIVAKVKEKRRKNSKTGDRIRLSMATVEPRRVVAGSRARGRTWYVHHRENKQRACRSRWTCRSSKARRNAGASRFQA